MDGDVDVGSIVLLEVFSSLLFILFPGDPDVIIIKVVQDPVTSTIPGVQHGVRGELNLKQITFTRRRLPSGIPGVTLSRPSDSPHLLSPGICTEEGSGKFHLRTLQTELS